MCRNVEAEIYVLHVCVGITECTITSVSKEAICVSAVFLSQVRAIALGLAMARPYF